MWRKFALLASMVLSAAAQRPMTDVSSGPWTAQLKGPWLWHAGDDMQWASPGFDDSSWPTWKVPGPPPNSDWVSTSTYWFRLHLKLGDLSDPGLLLGPIAYAYEIYWDGHLMGNFGQLPPSHGWLYPNWCSFRIPHESANSADHMLAIRASETGWLQKIKRIDPQENRVGDFNALTEVETNLRATDFKYQLLQLGVEWPALFAGLYFLLLPPSVSQGQAFRWFGAYLVANALWVLCNFLAFYGGFAVPAYLIGGASAVAGTLSVAVRIEFSYALFRQKVPGYVRVFEFLLILSISLVLIPPLFAATFQVWRVTYWHMLFAGALIPVAVAGRAVRERIPGAAVLCFLFAVIAAVVLPFLLNTNYGLRIQMETSFGKFRFSYFEAVLLLWIPAMAVQIHKTNQRFRDEQQRLRGEMEAARHVQEILLPSRVPQVPGFEIEASYQPATEVGGDFFQLFPASGDSLLLVVGDVSGKGMKAALLVSVIVGALQNRKSDQPAEVLRELNAVLRGRSEGGFTTCCSALFTPDGTLTIANAGHLAPYRNGREIETPPGLPLGVAQDASWDETRIELQPNDRILWISDGVVEARSGKRDLLGFERAQELATRSASEIAQAAQQFGQDDDITVVSVTRQAVAAYVA